MSEIEVFSKIEAVFRPRRIDDLKLGAVEHIGKRGVFEAAWIIEDGRPYAGEWAMLIPRDWDNELCDFSWVPSGDLDFSDD